MTNGGLLRSWIAPQAGNLADRLNRVNEPAAVAEQLYFLSIAAARPSLRTDNQGKGPRQSAGPCSLAL